MEEEDHKYKKLWAKNLPILKEKHGKKNRKLEQKTKKKLSQSKKRQEKKTGRRDGLRMSVKKD